MMINDNMVGAVSGEVDHTDIRKHLDYDLLNKYFGVTYNLGDDSTVMDTRMAFMLVSVYASGIVNPAPDDLVPDENGFVKIGDGMPMMSMELKKVVIPSVDITTKMGVGLVTQFILDNAFDYISTIAKVHEKGVYPEIVKQRIAIDTRRGGATAEYTHNGKKYYMYKGSTVFDSGIQVHLDGFNVNDAGIASFRLRIYGTDCSSRYYSTIEN